MTSDKNTVPFRQAFKAQARTLFQKKRYWFHIAIWVVAFVFLLANAISAPMKKGFDQGIATGRKQKAASYDTLIIAPQGSAAADTAGDSNTISTGNPDITISTNKKGSTTASIYFSDGDATIAGITTNRTFRFYISLLSVVSAAVMVYSFLLFFIPYARYKKKRRYIWIGVIINVAGWVVAIILVGIVLGIRAGGEEHLGRHDIIFSVLVSTIFSGVVVGYFFALYYFIDLYDQQKPLSTYKMALTERVEAETAFLRNQINPHFLFNTLNNIYSLLLNQSADAVFVTKELKNMMQYMLEDCAKESVLLSGEINFLKHYINLEKLRNQQKQVHVKFHVTGEPGDKEIAPLLLINFLENAFKHGVKAGFNEAYVTVHIDIKDNRLTLQLENSKPPLLDIGEDKAIKEDGGIGIVNVKRRLDILYPKRYKLNLQNSPNQYVVLLTIDLERK